MPDKRTTPPAALPTSPTTGPQLAPSASIFRATPLDAETSANLAPVPAAARNMGATHAATVPALTVPERLAATLRQQHAQTSSEDLLALVVDLLIAGRTLAQISADVGVPLITLMSWQTAPGFAEAYATGRRVRAMHIQTLIEDAAPAAVIELARLSVAARSEGDRIKAAESLLERAPAATRALAQPKDTSATDVPVVEISFSNRLASLLAGRSPDGETTGHGDGAARAEHRIDVTPPDDG